MYLFIAGFFAHVWIYYSGVIFNCLFWGMIGMTLLSPVMLAESMYKSHKISGRYHFRHAYHIERRNLQREILLYSFFFISALTILVLFIY